MKLRKEGATKKSKTVILIDVVAVIMLISFLLTFYNVSVYIMSLIDAGQVTFAKNWLDMILYYINNTSVYLALATLLFGLGYVVSYMKKQTVEVKAEEVVEVENKEEPETIEVEIIVEGNEEEK